MTRLAGWGRYPHIETVLHAPRDIEAVRLLLRQCPSLIARGNGRAYGDSAVNPGATLSLRHFNRMQSFDAKTGQLVAEAGVRLGDMIDAFLPRGWFPLVSPGTKFVTLGGAIAADAHGKNHHKDGAFRACVDWVEVMDTQGEITRCSREASPELFDHTLGGMGLTGIILRAAIRLRPVDSGWIRQTTRAARNLSAAMAIFEEHQEATYSVAWIDCLSQGSGLGRSLVMLGEHALRGELSPEYAYRPFDVPKKRARKMPFDLPRAFLNRMTVRAFNGLYYWAGQRKTEPELVDWDSYFYPLDAILGWNRIYGRKGFMQFQCALPLARSEEGLAALLKATSKAGQGSFLAVLKRFGPGEGAFSFPLEGYTLALDFPARPAALALMRRLDQITLEHGGRFYLAKDARMSAATLQASDPRAAGFVTTRAAQGWDTRFHSAQSERLSL